MRPAERQRVLTTKKKVERPGGSHEGVGRKKKALIQKDGGEMLIAIVLDKLLAEAKALVDDPAVFSREMTRILREKQSHPLIAQMMKPADSSDPPPANATSSSTGSRDKPCTCQSVQFQ